MRAGVGMTIFLNRLTRPCTHTGGGVSMPGGRCLAGRGVFMRTAVSKLFNDQGAELGGKIIALYVVLTGANVLAWIWALIAFHDYPVLIGTAFLAYTFGLRHAVDADHIAAIDNVTRKLMQEGKRPVAVGLFFSLGHSTVVVLASVGVALAAGALQNRFDSLKLVGGVIGTSVSALFLFLVAAANLLILLSVYRTFRHVRRGGAFIEEDLNHLLSQRGLLGRLFRPMFRLIERSWHMYPLGFLFGLGFDTATEIGLLGISAAEASRGLPIWSIMMFPALFTAGMTLIDTTDGILMIGAYGWAFTKPIRKLYYNLTITFVSVLVAVLIGGIEALGLLADQLKLEGPFWHFIGALNDNFGSLGYLIIAVFVGSWIVSIAVYRLARFELLEPAPG
jgi:nickel/cobalt transporter (NiCoT) family protein